MLLYNTMSMKKEEFTSLEPGRVRMYVCGPTVYNLIHVGNARPIIMFDALRRYLEYRGYEVVFVQNFTDVDDKIINRAAEEGCGSEELALRYISEYETDAKGLGVRPATFHPKATECIDEIIELIERLIAKGCAYVSEGDVYFRTDRFPGYGKLSHQPLEDLRAGARVEQSEVKESPVDFALWKAAKPQEPSWVSPWGDGRPGWHIECSAMSLKYLGETLDIHCGGADLTFPHHENEIAQSEAASGQTFVRYWLHNGFISVDNRKMSKSLGNFFTVRDAAAEYGYDALRMFMLMAHYRSPLNYSGEILEQAQAALGRLRTARANLEFFAVNGTESELSTEQSEMVSGLERYRERYIAALEDDFNTADAVAVVFELARECNSAVSPVTNPPRELARICLELFDELSDVLGLPCRAESDAIDTEIEALIEARQIARGEKNFAEADRIRDELKDRGIVLEDTPQGVKWRRS